MVERPLDVCLATMSFLPVYAGPAVRFAGYLPGLASRRIAVRVFTATPDEGRAAASGYATRAGESPAGGLLPVERVNGSPVHRVRLRGGERRRSLGFGRALCRFCLTGGTRPDVIQLLSLPFEATPAVARLRRLDVPLVYTATLLPRFRGPAAKRWLARQVTHFPWRFMDAVVVSSDIMREEFRRLGVRAPIVVIGNGVDTRRFRPPASAAERVGVRERLGIPASHGILMFVGPVDPRKGVDLLVEAWREVADELPDLHLVLVGPRLDTHLPVHGDFHARLEGLVAATPHRARIHFAGLVPDVDAWLRAADILVLPSRREGMPNVVPEAMASGLPVILTPFLGLPPEFGRAGEHYVLADFHPTVLAGAIRRLMADGERRRRLGDAARRWAVSGLDVEGSLDAYAALYRRLAAGRA